MTLSELQSGRRVSPWVISLLCIAPWFAVRQEDLSLARGVVTLALVGFGVVTAYFYGALDVRGPRWSREMDRYLGTPIREALIPLAPSDLKLSELSNGIPCWLLRNSTSIRTASCTRQH
jgi:hypothetical protein